MSNPFAVIAGLLAAALSLGPAPARAQGEIHFAVNEGVTYRITPHETRERYRDVAADLGRVLKRPVRIDPVEDYKALRKGLEERRFDLAYIHPAHIALQAIRDQQYQSVAVTKGWTAYKARFIGAKGTRLDKPQDLHGRKIVTPDADSITAWMARATLREAGLDPAKESIGVTRYQDGIPFMIENGFYSVGVTASNAVVQEWTRKGGVVLMESKPIAVKHLVAAPSFGRADVERVRQYFVELDRTERGRAILAALGFAGFEVAAPESLTAATKWLGL